MNPPYQLTSEIIRLIAEFSQKTGEINASFLPQQSPALRKKNRIKTIQASLAIEGNALSLDQVTAIIENKRVIGPSKDIPEVGNAIKAYQSLQSFNPFSGKSFLKAHQLLMKGLIPQAGKYRSARVGIVKGSQLTHLAAPARNVPHLMKELFRYLEKSDELILIKSGVFHYEMEFIHPFSDGNGRLGRLWQTVLLMQDYPVFEYLPFETRISKHLRAYYKALSIVIK